MESADNIIESNNTIEETTAAAAAVKTAAEKEVSGSLRFRGNAVGAATGASSGAEKSGSGKGAGSSAGGSSSIAGAAKLLSNAKPPAWLESVAKAVKPVAEKAGQVFKQMEPYLVQGWDSVKQLQTKLEPYHPDELLKVFFGIVLMFFGGSFVTIIAVFEAVRLCGFSQIYDALLEIFVAGKKLKTESDKDDTIDADGDGVADVKQISRQDLISRKVSLIIRTVEPEKVQNATSSLYAAFIAVMATLQSRFARVIALGASIGEEIEKPANRHLLPVLTPLFPEDYQRWVPMGVGYICKSIGVSLAWILQRAMEAFHSAVRGAKLFTDGVTAIAQRNGFGNLTEGYLDEIIAGALAFIGLYWQLSNGFSLPWLLYVLLYPFVLLEHFFSMLVGLY